MSSVRHVQVGARWEPPPPANGLDPDACTSLDDWRQLLLRLAEAAPAERQPTLQQALVRGFRGVSPQLARDLAAAAGVPPAAAPAALAPQQWDALWGGWQAWLERLASGAFAASSCQASGAYSLVGAQPEPVPVLLPFLHAYYTAEQRVQEFAGLQQQLARAITAATVRLHKKAESLARQGGEGDRHAGTQRQADLIMANLHRWVAWLRLLRQRCGVEAAGPRRCCCCTPLERPHPPCCTNHPPRRRTAGSRRARPLCRWRTGTPGRR